MHGKKYIRLTRGCISDCISASCTALGTWNRSISSIILAQRGDGAPPAARLSPTCVTPVNTDMRFRFV